jgi:hypothetical protein
MERYCRRLMDYGSEVDICEFDSWKSCVGVTGDFGVAGMGVDRRLFLTKAYGQGYTE